MEARLELKLQQKLIMTPQLQQAIKLLQLSRLELVQSVTQELVENPVLEEDASDESGEELSSEEGETAPESLSVAETPPEAAPEQEGTQQLRSDLQLGPQWDDYLNEMGHGRDYGNKEADDKELPSYD